MDVLEEIAERVELNWDLVQICYQEALNDLISKEMHLKAIQRSVAENSETLKEMQAFMEEQISQLKGREVSFDLSTGNSKDLGLKNKELIYVHNFVAEQKKLMDRFFENIELERKQFETNQKMTDDRFLEVCLKEVNANLIKMQNDNRATELDKREENLERRLKEMEMREVVLASRKAELIAEENALEAREKNLELRKELDLKKWELDSIKNSQDNCLENLHSPSPEQMEKSRKRYRNSAVKPKENSNADHDGPSRRNFDIEESSNCTGKGEISAHSGRESASGDDLCSEEMDENQNKPQPSSMAPIYDAEQTVAHEVSRADSCSREKSLSNPIDYSKSLINDFGKDRVQECFAVGQTWACYDNWELHMPRLYVKIVELVYCSYGFRMRAAYMLPPDHYLDWPEVHRREGWLAWINAGLPLGCGDFRRGSLRIKHVEDFSHQMCCEDPCKPYHIRIYPSKGEIWALYKDWNITTWASNPEHHRHCKYEVVEFLETDDSNGSAIVAYLDKIVGFVSLFQRRSQNETDSFVIQRSDIFRFSHKVPSFKMKGDETQGIPDGSFELDPKALPACLL